MEKHVYFIRHGQTDSNIDGIHRGRHAMLTDEGRDQAETVAKRIAKIGIDALLASSFPRALDTAAVIAQRTGLDVEAQDIFVEWLEPTPMFGKHKDDPHIRALYDEIVDATDEHYRHSDEETFAEFSGRAAQALRLLETHPSDRICVVTHGGFLHALFGTMVFKDRFTKAHFTGLLQHLHTTNTGITHARYDAGHGWRIMSWNDRAHLG